MARAYNQAQKFGVEMAVPDEVAGLEAEDDIAPRRFVLRLSNNERCAHVPWLSQAGLVTGGCQFRTWRDSRARACTIGPHPLKQSCAPGKRWRSWAAGIRRDRQPSTWRTRQPRFGCWYAVTILPRACRATSWTASAGLPTSKCWRGPASPASKAATECLKRFAGVAERRGKRFGGRSNIYSSSSVPNRTRIGLRDQAIALDAKGFVLTGADTREKLRPLETSREGVFAIGDVRSGSIKRVAAAVGEGAQVVAALHAYLATAGRDPAVLTSPAVHEKLSR